LRSQRRLTATPIRCAYALRSRVKLRFRLAGTPRIVLSSGGRPHVRPYHGDQGQVNGGKVSLDIRADIQRAQTADNDAGRDILRAIARRTIHIPSLSGMSSGAHGRTAVRSRGLSRHFSVPAEACTWATHGIVVADWPGGTLYPNIREFLSTSRIPTGFTAQ